MGEVFAGSRQVKKHEYASRPNAFLFKGIINSSRCSMYKDGGHIDIAQINCGAVAHSFGGAERTVAIASRCGVTRVSGG